MLDSFGAGLKSKLAQSPANPMTVCRSAGREDRVRSVMPDEYAPPGESKRF
jgi:hypothetical protein